MNKATGVVGKWTGGFWGILHRYRVSPTQCAAPRYLGIRSLQLMGPGGKNPFLGEIFCQAVSPIMFQLHLTRRATNV
jgi:hypothetical protein